MEPGRATGLEGRRLPESPNVGGHEAIGSFLTPTGQLVPGPWHIPYFRSRGAVSVERSISESAYRTANNGQATSGDAHELERVEDTSFDPSALEQEVPIAPSVVPPRKTFIGSIDLDN